MATATQAVPNIQGLIICSQPGKYLSGSLAWESQPNGMKGAYVHQVDVLSSLPQEKIGQIKCIFRGRYDHNCTTAMGLPGHVPHNFRTLSEKEMRRALQEIARVLLVNNPI